LKSLDEILKSIKKEKNPEKINDVLLTLGQDASSDHLQVIDFLISSFNSSFLEKVKINIIYLLGNIGQKEKLPKKYIDYLNDSYFNSDRWIRNEIIQALDKISDMNPISDQNMSLFQVSLKEDYDLIRISALNFISNLKEINNELLKDIILLLEDNNSRIGELTSKIINEHVKEEKALFDILNEAEFRKKLNKRMIRKLLVIIFDNPLKFGSLNSFKLLVENAKWEKEVKEMILNEIDIYIKIFLKTI